MYQPHATVIGDKLWARLKALAPQRVRPARSVLLRQGDPATHVIVLESGSTLITLAGVCGERTLLAVRGAGELLGELAVLDSQPRTATVIAAETCQIRIIPAAAFLAFVDEHDLLAPLLRHAIARVRESETVRLELATASVPLRLASALSRLVEAASASDLAVRLTQTELSQMIGASRNAVVNALKPWREQDWVRTTSSGGLLVRDIHSIQSHARTKA
ncbi:MULTISPECIES: Crp/Fnr family transcriptional regulator [Streptomyces]|uniref:Crp/Fnr family transcriptional regulator n=1 Tax=Streptomyces evansiae TaxID=3075535 RepID=A0ABU2QV30_9ACTN|nr:MULTISPECIES: Crp/Fnr family transcriptional regulator [unclassified Streptomyces]MDT0408309.1 Crp/Fnr family transcriptional regulator [Streptomyces sp. DSM 41979]MYQ57732.1 cyclic nucleotide-binding domain-containing protein [Streptomyces sp. SID4926]SCE20878.1 cAMP-binding domain of CRP or a regulatory subunit of cAMP-dependent protein kinases [Streptomyces sp. DfronAA-171]